MKPFLLPPKTKTLGVPDDESTMFRSVKKDLKRRWTTSNKWDKGFWIVIITLMIWAVMSGLFNWQWAQPFNDFIFGSDDNKSINDYHWQSPGN